MKEANISTFIGDLLMGPEITITIKIATTTEGTVVSEVRAKGDEGLVPTPPSMEVLPEIAEGHVPEPPAYEELYEFTEGNVPSPNLESITEVSEDELFGPPELVELEEIVENDVPSPPDVDNEARYEEFNEQAEIVVPPLPSA